MNSHKIRLNNLNAYDVNKMREQKKTLKYKLHLFKTSKNNLKLNLFFVGFEGMFVEFIAGVEHISAVTAVVRIRIREMLRLQMIDGMVAPHKIFAA